MTLLSAKREMPSLIDIRANTTRNAASRRNALTIMMRGRHYQHTHHHFRRCCGGCCSVPRQRSLSSLQTTLFVISFLCCLEMSHAWVLPSKVIAPTSTGSTSPTRLVHRHWSGTSMSLKPSTSPSASTGTTSTSGTTMTNSPTALFLSFSNPYQNSSVAVAWPGVMEKDSVTVQQQQQQQHLEQGTVPFRFVPDNDEESLHLLHKKKHDDGSISSTTSSLETASLSDISSVVPSLREEEETGSAVVSLDDDAILFARLLLVGAACLYGTSFSLVKMMGESELPVGISTTIRFGLAALATSPWLISFPSFFSSSSSASSQNSKESTQDHWPAIVAGFEVGLWNSVGYVAQAVGLETTSASTSAFLCSLAVVVVPFLDVWLSGRQLKGRQWMGAFLALAGVGFLELGHGFAGSWSTGDFASMLQPFAFGFGFWRLETAMHQYPAQSKRSTAAQILAVFLGCVLYTAATETVALDQVVHYLWSDPTTLGLFVFVGVISTALSVYMESVALKTLTASETTVLLSTEPLWGALWAALLVNEQLGMDTLSGGLLILTGCLYSSLGWKRLKALASGRIASRKSGP